jgi:WD40 repeat protein
MVWTSKALGDPVSFCSPMMIMLPERDINKKLRDVATGKMVEKLDHYPELNILVTLSHSYLLGINAKTGEVLWSHKEDSVKLEGEHCNTPLYADGFIYSISGDENGNGAYKIRLSDDGKRIREVWRNGKVKNPLGGFMKIGDRIYTTSDDKKLKVLDVNTGQIVETLSGMKGSLIAADNLLFCYTDNGYVNLISGVGSKLEVAGKFKITKGEKEHFAHPVIANGVLYVRHGNVLMAYQVK